MPVAEESASCSRILRAQVESSAPPQDLGGDEKLSQDSLLVNRATSETCPCGSSSKCPMSSCSGRIMRHSAKTRPAVVQASTASPVWLCTGSPGCPPELFPCSDTLRWQKEGCIEGPQREELLLSDFFEMLGIRCVQHAN